MKIEVKEIREPGVADYTFYETLLDDGGVYRIERVARYLHRKAKVIARTQP